jgi:ubiquinone/menaquinone biosynthesis C-methylase UbiE
MDNKQRNFDQEAADWDKEPRRVKLANDIANAVLSEVKLTSEMNVLDFGCGTGLVTLRLSPLVRSIKGVDSSPGMLDVLNQKARQHGLINIETQQADIEQGDLIDGQFDLIVSSMTLHHLKQINVALKYFYQLCAPGARICIADLDSDNGLFHEDNSGVFHFGFDRAWFCNALQEAGYSDIRDTTATEVTKTNHGTLQRFSIFLISGTAHK